MKNVCSCLFYSHRESDDYTLRSTEKSRGEGPIYSDSNPLRMAVDDKNGCGVEDAAFGLYCLQGAPTPVEDSMSTKLWRAVSGLHRS